MNKINEVKAPIVTKILKLDEVTSYSQFAVSGIDSSLNKLQHILDEYVYLKKQAQKQEKVLGLYKEFFDKLNIQLRNTFDIDYIYPHEFIIGYDIKSEDKELVKLFKQIKELEKR